MRLSRLLLRSLVAASALFPFAAGADVLTLKDGTKVEGDIKKAADGSGYEVVGADGTTVTKVPYEKVKGVQLKTLVTPDEAQKRLDSLRRSANNIPDPKTAISRYKEFIARYPDTPAIAEAKKDLALWQDRADKGMTKSGDKWVTPAELGAIQEHSLAGAIHARRLLKQGRLKEAGPILDQALKDDPKNASAHYLRGVMLYRQEQLGPARKAFEAIPPLVPDHAPTANNLAVILFRQNNFVAALNQFDAAMLAAPEEPVILNNVAEALNALPQEHRASQVTKKVVRHFNEQDEVVAAAMAKENRYRWGATWVTGDELDKLQSKEREIKDKITVLEDQYAAAKAQLDQIEQDITDTRRSLRRMELDTYRTDATGRTTRRPYPQIYYELRRDLQDLERERVDQETEIERLRKEGKKVQQEMPVPRYSGIQRLIEVEGTPLLPRNDPQDAAPDTIAPPPADAPAPPADAPVPPAPQPPVLNDPRLNPPPVAK